MIYLLCELYYLSQKFMQIRNVDQSNFLITIICFKWFIFRNTCCLPFGFIKANDNFFFFFFKGDVDLQSKVFFFFFFIFFFFMAMLYSMISLIIEIFLIIILKPVAALLVSKVATAS